MDDGGDCRGGDEEGLEEFEGVALGGDCVGEEEEGGGKVVAKGGGTMLGRDKGGDDEFAIFTQIT